MLRLGENSENNVQGALPPPGEPVVYSPTSPGGSPDHSTNLDNDSMAGAVENDEEVEDDLRDLVMLYQGEERKAARQRKVVDDGQTWFSHPSKLTYANAHCRFCGNAAACCGF